jgi:phage gp29-like protein
MGVRATLHEAVASGMTPERLAGVLKRATTGEIRDYLTLAEEMEERYLHYASQVQTRRLAIEGVDISFEVPKGVPTKIADAVERMVVETDLAAAAGMLTDGIAKGFAVVEPIWDYVDGLMQPVEYRWRDQRYFQFDRAGMTQLRLASDASLDGDPLPATAFICHLPRAKAGIPIRRGFARAAAWAFILQSFALKDWAAFAEIYGVPMRVGKYHAGASGTDKATLLRAVASIANDAAAIIPQGMEIEFIGVEGSKGEAVFGALLEYLDRNVSKLVVGQTMTADDGSSMAQAKVHNEVRLDILRADCRQTASTLNRFLRLFVAVNFGPQDVYPKLQMLVAEPEDVTALTTAVAAMMPYGFRVKQRELREKMGLSEPDEGDELLAPQRPPEVDAGDDEKRPPLKSTENRQRNRALNLAETRHTAALLATSAHSCRCSACGGQANLSADAVDLPPPRVDVEAELEHLVDDTLSEWREMTEPMLAPLLAAVEKAKDFDELIALLPAAAKGMDCRRLAEQLAQLGAIARGLGDASD